MKSKFQALYNIVMEELEKSTDIELEGCIRRLSALYSSKGIFNQAIAKALRNTVKEAIEKTNEALENSKKTGEKVKLVNPFNNAVFEVTTIDLSKTDNKIGKIKYVNGLRPYVFAVNMDDRQTKVELSNIILKSEHDKIIELAKNMKEQAEKESAEIKEKLETSPEFAQFKKEAKEKGFNYVFGYNHQIGMQIPDEFYEFFKQQSDEVKKLFIEYVKRFSIYDSSIEYVDRGYLDEKLKFDKRITAKEAFIKKLEENL